MDRDMVTTYASAFKEFLRRDKENTQHLNKEERRQYEHIKRVAVCEYPDALSREEDRSAYVANIERSYESLRAFSDAHRLL